VAIAAVVYAVAMVLSGGVSRAEWHLARDSLRFRRGRAPAP